MLALRSVICIFYSFYFKNVVFYSGGAAHMSTQVWIQSITRCLFLILLVKVESSTTGPASNGEAASSSGEVSKLVNIFSII